MWLTTAAIRSTSGLNRRGLGEAAYSHEHLQHEYQHFVVALRLIVGVSHMLEMYGGYLEVGHYLGRGDCLS